MNITYTTTVQGRYDILLGLVYISLCYKFARADNVKNGNVRLSSTMQKSHASVDEPLDFVSMSQVTQVMRCSSVIIHNHNFSMHIFHFVLWKRWIS